MGALGWMEWFGWQPNPQPHCEATDCPCPECVAVKILRAGWTEVGRAFREIAYLRFVQWRVVQEREDWPSLCQMPLAPTNGND